jgi:hypothetical protein
MLARVATFEGGNEQEIRANVAEIQQRAGSGPPEGVPARGFTMLHQADQGKVLAITLFETPEDYEQGDAKLNEMSPPSGAMGRRVSLERYEVGVDLRL